MSQPPACAAPWGKVLACTDGSQEARHAVSEALALARNCSATVSVLRVIEIVPEFEAVAPDLRSQENEEVREEMQAIRDEAAGLGVPVETRLRQCQLPHRAILAEAAEIGVDLIVMGRSGESGLESMVMGSVTARVVAQSPMKVLVVPRGGSLDFARILVASDGSPPSEVAWEEAVSLARQAESRLFAVTAAREEGEIIEARKNIDRLLAAANRNGIPFTGIAPEGQQPDDAIVQEALRHEVGLIIMGTRGYTGLKRLLLGSVTERVLSQAPCPVLVVKKT